MSLPLSFRSATALVARQSLSRKSIPILARRQLASAPASSPPAVHSEPASSGTSGSPQTREGWLFVDSIFPVRIGTLDFRHYIALFRQETLLNKIETLLSSVKTHDFKILALEPRVKDGGVFVRFQYSAGDEEGALDSIQNDLRKEVGKHGGLPSWVDINRGQLWVVKGRPWREDLRRFASPMLRVAFEGPDLQEESLYELFRPYGRIQDLTPPAPGASGAPRSSLIIYTHLRSAAVAHNVIHGASIPSGPAPDAAKTRLRTAYETPIKAHAVRDWLTSHPRIVLPIVFFLLGTLTYTIFDPIRVFAVEAKLLGWLDYRQFTLFKWIRANTLNTLNMFSLTRRSDHSDGTDMPSEGVWKERQDAAASLRNYLSDYPNTVAFVHGPQGSGKSRMLDLIVKDTPRKVLSIDCSVLYKANSDSALVSSLASMVGYWPAFPFLNSMNNMIDLASMGLIGQKAGLSSSLEDQLKQILEVTGTGLQAVISSTRKSAVRRADAGLRRAEHEEAAKVRRERIIHGVWHDGRLDCVAGNGVMCELGVGDERMGEWEWIGGELGITGNDNQGGEGRDEETYSSKDGREKQRSVEDVQAVGALPIVIIKNYAMKGGIREELLGVLAQWAATLVENGVAHVIVVSDNRENAKRLAQALPSKPLASVALYDADAASALSFVKQRLREANVEHELTPEETAYVDRLGGRAVDLESLIHKVHTGQKIQEAVEDIISRGITELRKNAFGDDAEDAKSLQWSREQAWAVLKRLSKEQEIPYHDVLVEFPFKGDETALRNMEHAELITIGTYNGRPSTIRPGKPVYHYVFERLVEDTIFQAVQDIAYNEKAIASAESTVRACEDELLTLKDVEALVPRPWLGFGGKDVVATRAAYLLEKMRTAEAKVEALERRNKELKGVLAKGG